jgi:hypothetical protein
VVDICLQNGYHGTIRGVRGAVSPSAVLLDHALGLIEHLYRQQIVVIFEGSDHGHQPVVDVRLCKLNEDTIGLCAPKRVPVCVPRP